MQAQACRTPAKPKSAVAHLVKAVAPWRARFRSWLCNGCSMVCHLETVRAVAGLMPKAPHAVWVSSSKSTKKVAFQLSTHFGPPPSFLAALPFAGSYFASGSAFRPITTTSVHSPQVPTGSALSSYQQSSPPSPQWFVGPAPPSGSCPILHRSLVNC